MIPERISTVAQWLDAWLELVARSRRESAYMTYRPYCHYATSVIGQVRLDRVRIEHIEQVYANMAKMGLSPVTN